MNRGLPMQNRICFYRKQYEDDRFHEQQLNQIKGKVDDNIPQSSQIKFIKSKPHIYNKYDEYRFNEIDRENHKLAEKMVGINQNRQNK